MEGESLKGQTGNDVIAEEEEEGNIELWDDRRENRPTFFSLRLRGGGRG